MSHRQTLFLKFLYDECGQDLIEYALIVGLIGLAAITMLTGLATNIATALGNMGTKLTTSV